MKHPASREFFAYWDGKRGDARAPERSDIEPNAVRERLGDIFVLSCDASYPFRVAGTRVCAMFGRDLKDKSFPALFAPESRAEIEEIVGAVTDEMLPAIAGLTATSSRGTLSHLELLLLPFNSRAHTPISLTGLLAPFETSTAHSASSRFPPGATSIRRNSHSSRARCASSKIARGFMVYEGLR